jgi:predicted MFS family arabinose efflux permease
VADVSVAVALRTRSLWLLVGSFFICGFTTVGLITTHLVPYLIDVGFSATTAADGAGLLGGMTVFGLLAIGAVGDRYHAHKGAVLAAVYFLRGLVFLVLVSVATALDIFVFAALYGFFYYGTVPLHTGLTADRFGKGNLTTLVGIQYAGHQVGGATAAVLAGWIFDVQGSYVVAHLLGMGLLILAAALIVAETRLGRPSAAEAAAD